MSEYTIVECEIESADHVVSALEALGIPRASIEVHEDLVNLIGYEGRSRANKAHVIVRKNNVNKYLSAGCSNDLGFEKAEGKFRVHVSDYDRRWWNLKEVKFKNEAACAKATELARKRGYKIERTDEGEVIRLKLIKPF